MKIYVLTHLYDNGLSYEDKMNFEDNYYYSSLEVLNMNKPAASTQGMWIAKEIELDTQETKTIWQTEWIPCVPDYNYGITDDGLEEPEIPERVLTDEDAIEDYLQNNRSNVGFDAPLEIDNMLFIPVTNR